MACRLKHLFRQLGIVHEEEDVPHQRPHRVALAQPLEVMPIAPRELVDRVHRGRYRFAAGGELARERRPERHVTAIDLPQVRDFIAEQRRVGRRQARDGRLARARPAGEYERAAVADPAGGVEQESAARGQQQRMDNSQHRVDRVRIDRLLNPAAPGSAIPLGAKIAAPKRPLAVVNADGYVRIGAELVGRHDGDLEFVRRRGCGC